jgi:microcystin-dependent protein
MPGSLGGSLQPLNDAGPQLTERYMIAVNGVFPSQGGGSGVLDYIGSIVKSAFDFEIGAYMECDGRNLLISDYEVLFNVIGTTYGGDGITTFAIPDLRGRTMVGAGGDHFVGDSFGNDSVNITNANLPANMGGNDTGAYGDANGDIFRSKHE